MCVFTLLFFCSLDKTFEGRRACVSSRREHCKGQYLVPRPVTLTGVKPHTRLTGVFTTNSLTYHLARNGDTTTHLHV